MRRATLSRLIREAICEHPVESIPIEGLAYEVQNKAYDLGEEIIPSAPTIIRAIRSELKGYRDVLRKEGRYTYVCKRLFIPPVEFLTALDEVYRMLGKPYGTRLFWDRIYPIICRLTLLDSSYTPVMNTLRAAAEVAGVNSPWAKQRIFDYGWEGGFGLWVILMDSFKEV